MDRQAMGSLLVSELVNLNCSCLNIRTNPRTSGKCGTRSSAYLSIVWLATADRQVFESIVCFVEYGIVQEYPVVRSFTQDFLVWRELFVSYQDANNNETAAVMLSLVFDGLRGVAYGAPPATLTTSRSGNKVGHPPRLSLAAFRAPSHTRLRSKPHKVVFSCQANNFDVQTCHCCGNRTEQPRSHHRGMVTADLRDYWSTKRRLKVIFHGMSHPRCLLTVKYGGTYRLATGCALLPHTLA
jgi:hypothetical protein